MNNVKLLIAGSAFFAMSAQAADRVSIDVKVTLWICPYISRHLLSLNPLLACCRRYSRGER
ncbi:putative transcriptional regulator [Escherichia coli]|nr:putative transcriptional regulator [Escherichia coli]